MKGYRTLAFAAGVALLGVAETFDWTQVVTGPDQGPIITLIGCVIAVLRVLTTSPVFRK
jgi:hypothetical protein